jgi:ubiquinone biosynthesis protein UbiJ
MNLTLSTAALAGLEKLINSALRYDPGTRIALGKLSDQILAVTISSPALTIYLTPDDEGVRLMSQWEGEVHTHLYGSLPALIKLVSSERTSFTDSGVEVVGNTGLLVDLQRLLKNLDIDWEEALSEFLGDIVGHQSAEAIRSGVNYTRDRADELRRSTSEFLTEELQALVSKNELEDFYQQVDDLRLQLDRLEARARKLMGV